MKRVLKISTSEESRVIALGSPGVLNATVTSVQLPGASDPHAELRLGGFEADGRVRVRWDTIRMKEGDAVLIEFCDWNESDPPDEVTARDEEVENGRRETLVRLEAARRGWEIVDGTLKGDAPERI